MSFALVVTHDDDYMPPDVYGPFVDVPAAQTFAEEYRGRVNLPREATPENNEVWTDIGWYFGIVELRAEFPTFSPDDGPSTGAQC